MSMKLADFVLPQAVVPELEGTDRDAVIRELVEALVQAGAAPASIEQDLIREILSREKKGSTGFGRGVAVPHVKHEKVERMAAAIGVAPNGIDFNALDKQPVYSVVLLLSPTDQAEQHLQAMESIFSHLQREIFRKFLRQASTQDQVLELIQEADSQKLQG